jgi:NitT/TauT family transport system ATP-binding protein
MSVALHSDEAVRPAGERLLRLKDVGKVFSDGTAAVEGVTLSLRRGEFLTLLGPSGCGKSTVLRMIAGLGAPTSGSIQWRNSALGAESRLSYVFQEPTLMPWARVAANVRLPLRIDGTSGAEADRRVADALAMVGLEGFADRFPRQLSGGMKMRVSIARALVTRPTILLMDEPFAALDEITRFRLNDDLLRLCRSHRLTVIFVTHSVYESVYLSTRIAIMTRRPGRLFADLDVDLPDRDEGFRTSPAYNACCRLVSERLHQAIESRAVDGR